MSFSALYIYNKDTYLWPWQIIDFLYLHYTDLLILWNEIIFEIQTYNFEHLETALLLNIFGEKNHLLWQSILIFKEKRS